MKQYAKLFEDFLNEDELDDILGDTGETGKDKDNKDGEGGDKKEDPIKKLQDEQKNNEKNIR